jgi:hypothetical protein
MNIVINTRKSAAIEAWQAKEKGSYEDHNRSQSHPFAILNRWGGKLSLTLAETEAIIKSGSYHSTAWDDEDIKGGAKTKTVITSYCKKLREALNKTIKQSQPLAGG